MWHWAASIPKSRGQGPGPGAGPGGRGAGPGPGIPPGAGRGPNQGAPNAAGDPVGPGGPWRLFNLRDDPAERDDLSRQHPDVLAQMLSEWNRYVADNGVIVKAGTAQ